MAEKKTKHTQLVFLRLENVESGSGIRGNLMYILFKAIAMVNNGEYRDSKHSISVMMKGDCTETYEEAVKTDKECVSMIDYAGYYSQETLDMKAEKLAELCKENDCKLGPTTVIRVGNKLGMESELFYWEWTI